MSDRRLLMIPGPIELEPDVLATLGERQRSHMDAGFADAFGRALDRMRGVFLAGKDAQPILLAGSGTLAMDSAVANLVEPGDGAVVVDTGYFSARMADALGRWGARVTRVGAAVGDAPALDAVEVAIARERPAVVTITHVDTSTGVRTDVASLAKVARAHGALVVVDGVCSVGAEELRHEAWGLDVTLTASQKAIGAPPGLALIVASPRAIEKSRARKTKLASMYLDWAEWLPIMRSYEERKPQYFATPAVNLVAALDVSLGQLLAEGMEARFARHARLAGAFRAAWKALELRPLTVRDDLAANTLSALYYPVGVDASLVGKVAAQGVVVAGGLHPDAKTKYFRVGHMGTLSPNDVLATVGAIERALAAAGHAKRGVQAASDALAR
jgi:alanine-glyoxylate transaminase/serine-glyoxylate transaminase/serine-pyruvate transaminase